MHADRVRSQDVGGMKMANWKKGEDGRMMVMDGWLLGSILMLDLI